MLAECIFGKQMKFLILYTMNLKIKHLLLLIVSLVLLAATLCVPMPARDSEQMKEIRFGYPLAFVSQNFIDYDTFSFFPRYLKFEPFNRSVEKVYWLNLLVSFLSIFAIIELTIFILEFASFGIRKRIYHKLSDKKIKNKNKKEHEK